MDSEYGQLPVNSQLDILFLEGAVAASYISPRVNEDPASRTPGLTFLDAWGVKFRRLESSFMVEGRYGSGRSAGSVVQTCWKW